MAPRSHGAQQGTTRGVGSTSRLPSASTGVGRSTPGHRGILNANTGAGVNARRSTATENRARGGGSPHVHRHQRMPQARRSTAAPRLQDDRVGRRQEHGRLSNNNDRENSRQPLPLPSRTPTTTTTTTTNTRSPPTFPIRRINSTPLHLSTPPLGSSRLTRIYPPSSSSHRTLSPLPLSNHAPSFTLPPSPPAPPIRMLNTIPSTSTPSFLFPKTHHNTKQPLYRGNDEIKRAVSNPNLRAILAGRAWPRERKKAAGERPVLRMGMSKEYK